MIVLENLEKSYDGKKVLRNINLTLEPGKIYGILGKDFSGKTSLLKIISGQMKADSGKALFEGVKIYEKPDIIENISLVREEGIGIDDLKVKKMMNLARIAYKNWDEEFKELLVEEFDIDMDQRFYRLTREKQTLVGVVIGLASRAEWTVFDEPTLGLSKINAAKFCEIMRRDILENPRTVVISNSRIDCTSNLFDSIVIMREGRIILDEELETVKNRLFYASGQKSIIDIQLEKNVIFKEQFGDTTVVGIYDDISTMEKYAYGEKNIDISKMPLYRAYSYFTEEYIEPEKEEDMEVILKMYGDDEAEEEIIVIEEEHEEEQDEEPKVIKSEVTQTVTEKDGEEIVETVSKDIIEDISEESGESEEISEETGKIEIIEREDKEENSEETEADADVKS